MEDRTDSFTWSPVATIQKWHNSDDHLAGTAPDEVVEFEGNLLANAGITRLLDKLIGNSGQVYDSGHARIGVGDSSTSASASQTDLQASSNKYYRVVDSISVSGQTLTAVATFSSGDANFAWNEWCIDQGTTSGSSGVATMLNRKVASMGTKSSGTWVITVQIQVA